MSDSFRTKAGRCVVSEGTIHLDSDGMGWLATLRDALTTDEIPLWRRASVVLFYVALVAGIVLAVRVAPPWLPGAAAGLLLAAFAWSWYAERNREVEPVEEIPLSDVVSVEPYFGLPLVTRPRFVIRYHAEGGVKHRYVMCPSRLYGFGAYEKGKELFDQRGLLIDGAAEGPTTVDA